MQIKMKKLLAIVLLALLIGNHGYTQVVVDSSLLLSQWDMKWGRDFKFDLFIHFGLYSVLKEGEWVMFNKRLDTSEYGKLRDSFTVSKFVGKNWVNVAKQMKIRTFIILMASTGYKKNQEKLITV
jgi:alpha-L-fucosidase